MRCGPGRRLRIMAGLVDALRVWSMAAGHGGRAGGCGAGLADGGGDAAGGCGAGSWRCWVGAVSWCWRGLRWVVPVG